MPADQPVRQNRPAGEAAVAAAVDDSSHVAPVPEGSDRMMDSGPEPLDRPDEGVISNDSGAAAAADRGAEHVISLSLSLGRPVSTTLRARTLHFALCFSLFLSRGLCVDHGDWTSCGPPVRVPWWNARVRHGEAGCARRSRGVERDLRRWRFFANALARAFGCMLCV